MRLYPKGMRPSTLTERRGFYENEFDTEALSGWIGRRARHLKFAMILGRSTGLVAEGKESLKDDVVIIDDWRGPEDLRRFALDYLPESMYYDRNRYVDVRECARCGKSVRSCKRCVNFGGQQLAFDLDPENVDCPYHGHIGEKIDQGRAHGFCMYEFKAVRRQALELSSELADKYEFVQVVYSGRGFHVVVEDESAYGLSGVQRKRIAGDFGKRFSIDEWVTEGSSRLMRLPGSLNGLVSRKCIVIKGEKVLRTLDPRTSKLVVPEFIGRV